VLSGKYVLVALTIDASTDPLGHNQKPVYGFLQDIEVGNRDVVGFDVALQPLRDLAGEVTFGEGCKPVPLTIRPSGYAMAMPGEEPVVSGADGAFVLTRLTSGRFTVNVSWDSGPSPGPGAQVSSIRLGERDVQKDGLDVPYSGDGPLRIAISCTASGRPQ
jgi:hypothetical protein